MFPFSSRMHSFQAHEPHQALHTLSVHLVPLSLQAEGHAPAAKERALHILLINEPHELEIFIAFPSRLVIIARSRQRKKLTLPDYADPLVAGLYESSLAFSPQIPVFFSASPAQY